MKYLTVFCIYHRLTLPYSNTGDRLVIVLLFQEIRIFLEFPEKIKILYKNRLGMWKFVYVVKKKKKKKKQMVKSVKRASLTRCLSLHNSVN